MPFRSPSLSVEQRRAEAEDFLDRCHESRTIPIPIEEIVEFELSMDVFAIDGIKEELGVDAFLSSDLGTIVVDAWVVEHAPARLRFSRAHEIGHYWIHDQLYQDNKIASVQDWKRIQDTIGEGDYDVLERQANRFAGFVLMPGDLLRTNFADVRARAQSAGIGPERLDHQPYRQRVIQELAARFAVSDRAMEIRLVDEGLLSRL